MGVGSNLNSFDTAVVEMHELSLGEALVKIVLEELAARKIPPGRLRIARVAVGRLHQVVPDALQFAYEAFTQDTPAAGSKLELHEIPLLAHCPDCNWDGEIVPPVFRCGNCHAGRLEWRTGREFHLEALEIETEP